MQKPSSHPAAATAPGDSAAAPPAQAQAAAPLPASVGVDNFVRAETDTYLAGLARLAGVGQLRNARDLASIDHQRVIRTNRDTLYSSAVLDLDAGPATITLPDAGKRYLSLHVINQDHYTTNIIHGAGAHTVAKEGVGTRYAYVIIRMFVDPGSADDLQQARALQDAVRISQKGPGTLELPSWDAASLKKVRETLL